MTREKQIANGRNNLKQKMIGETKAIHEFAKLNIPTFKPLNDTNGCDLVIDYEGRLLKVQVKSCISGVTNGDHNAYTINIVKIRPNRTENKRVRYTLQQVDLFAVYLVDIDTMCYIPFSEIDNYSNITFRTIPPKRHNQYKHRLISDYKVLKKWW